MHARVKQTRFSINYVNHTLRHVLRGKTKYKFENRGKYNLAKPIDKKNYDCISKTVIGTQIQEGKSITQFGSYPLSAVFSEQIWEDCHPLMV